MKRYAIVIEKSPTNYGAYVPDLPGCIATGPTVKETERLLRESIALHLQGMKEDGIAVPEPSSVVEYLELEVGRLMSHLSSTLLNAFPFSSTAPATTRTMWSGSRYFFATSSTSCGVTALIALRNSAR